MTVLFADVVRSMDLADLLDSERLREVMSELFNRCGAIVQRYGGTVDKFTGDGIMAIFGAPIALEDHAARACLAALEIQRDVRQLAVDLRRRDGVEYALRVGLNSGEVVTGQIGLDATSYTAVGAQVGMAQRMESVAPPGCVMVSESTARLVEQTAVFGERRMVEIKHSASPVPARVLLAMGPRRWLQQRHESRLIGRDSELGALAALLDDARAGRGHVVTVCGPPGIGKSRIGRELADLAETRGVTSYSTFCESHARDLPFHVIARLLRDVFGVGDVDDVLARSRIRALLSADDEDVQMLEALLGVGDPGADTEIPADARRRRLTRLVVDGLSARRDAAVLIVEDVHWIDEVSETMLTEILSAVTKSPLLAVITHRPEYSGPLDRIPGASHIVLTPLHDSEAVALTASLMGTDPSLGPLQKQIIDRAAGNPFFVYEIVRDLAERGIIAGDAGDYVRRGDATDVAVPPTLQAAIAARIDRLATTSKHVLNAAAVIGSQFATDMLVEVVEGEPESIRSALSELVHAELVHPVAATSSTEYAFRHPMIRTVAEESQLKSGRSALHRRLAGAIVHRHQQAADENAGVIASHFEAAGDLREAFGWYMRAGSWLVNRDIAVARSNWQRAREIADRLPVDEPDRITMRIAPRSLLCGSAWRAGGSVADTGFDELRRLCEESHSQIPLVMGMAGLMSSLSVHARIQESAELADEYLRRVDSIGDRTLTVGLTFPAIHANYLAGKVRETLRLSQRVIDLADGDATMGNLLTGSPLAFATAMRAIASCCLGEAGWRADFDAANAIAHAVDPTTFVSTVFFKWVTGIALGALVPGPSALSETGEALDIAQRYSEDMALGLAAVARGTALVQCGDESQRQQGFALLRDARDLAMRDRYAMTDVPIINTQCAADSARAGNIDTAIGSAEQVLDDLDRSGGAMYRGAATTVLVTSLLRRQAEGDLARAKAAVQRLADAPIDEGSVMNELPLLRLRALLAHAGDDHDSYRRLADRYRTRANSLGFEAHIRYASAMT